MEGLKKLSNLLNNLLSYLAKVMLAFVTLLIVVDVFCRYVLSFSLGWSEEVSLIVLVWICFITMSIGVKKRLHISVGLFINHLSENIRVILRKFIDLLILVFSVLLSIYGFKLTKNALAFTLSATGFPAAIVYAAIPVAGVVIVFNTLLNFFGILKMDEEYDEIKEAIKKAKEESINNG